MQYYHRSASLAAGLQTLKQAADQAEDREAGQKSAAQTDTAREPAPGAGAPVSITELAREIATCRLCALSQTRKTSTPGKGGSKPRLLVVGDWLLDSAGTARDSLFGEQQDQMLGRMIEAIELQSSDVFITNLIKCSVPDSVTPEPSQIATCLGYLKQQITLLSPRVLLTMGSAAAQTLLGSGKPLIALRGRFHQFRLGSDQHIALMATFHPSYLLKNPEMKQPTWNDLQAVKKKLVEGH